MVNKDVIYVQRNILRCEPEKKKHANLHLFITITNVDRFSKFFMENARVNEFLKSANIWESYEWVWSDVFFPTHSEYRPKYLFRHTWQKQYVKNKIDMQISIGNLN